ncbi:hypothetical protein BJ508DRAFT_363671 [Ascobolus immersus RN42]|uniref:Yeast cell wall synthesis Kre9/Knh1-like N-terminal domain-containing protein n=1 Tax=Ascobolus immersus RN42 TaxID=1160509 RepID=A0A3N4HXR7_ASCIM|nr:hypothetical protein BJ508DRAFT_363671 [Ascobolus immersus RN42]
MRQLTISRCTDRWLASGWWADTAGLCIKPLPHIHGILWSCWRKEGPLLTNTVVFLSTCHYLVLPRTTYRVHSRQTSRQHAHSQSMLYGELVPTSFGGDLFITEPNSGTILQPGQKSTIVWFTWRPYDGPVEFSLRKLQSTPGRPILIIALGQVNAKASPVEWTPGDNLEAGSYQLTLRDTEESFNATSEVFRVKREEKEKPITTETPTKEPEESTTTKPKGESTTTPVDSPPSTVPPVPPVTSEPPTPTPAPPPVTSVVPPVTVTTIAPVPVISTVSGISPSVVTLTTASVLTTSILLPSLLTPVANSTASTASTASAPTNGEPIHKARENPDLLGAAIGGSLGALLLLVAIAFFLLRKRRPEEQQPVGVAGAVSDLERKGIMYAPLSQVMQGQECSGTEKAIVHELEGQPGPVELASDNC